MGVEIISFEVSYGHFPGAARFWAKGGIANSIQRYFHNDWNDI
jgi:hypothetical protein